MAKKTIKRTVIKEIRDEYLNETSVLSKKLGKTANDLLKDFSYEELQLLKNAFAHVVLEDLLVDRRTF